MEDKKTQLYLCAKKLFSENGYKDTNISDITKLAETAVGTFYNYYPSKENLFLEIFLEENAKLKRECLQSIDLSQPPLTVVRQMMAQNAEGIRDNPILREWYQSGAFEKIERIYRQENGIEAVDFLYDAFLEIVTQWQAQGKMRSDIDSKMIMMVFTAMISIDTHKDEIGLEYFPQIIEIMTELIMKGLTDCGS